ncbi:MAG: RecQ family ATP-dependent DNA helicase [Verrucomicrobiaceae bacterium]|nr:RecQ family ATP-dependent DNA helicase [Verrucomicrobiaceae bacterium]
MDSTTATTPLEPELPDSAPDTSPLIHDARAALQQYFGFRDFLDNQENVISGILSGRDTLVIMPTGGGKSLCYQLPAMVMEGVTVVVSPLIALMKDQVDALQAKGIPATVINSTLSPSEQMDRISALRAGHFRLVYVAPERFRQRSFVDSLRSVDIALFAVDEAHCLSQWGHDFRPDYLRLREALEKLDRPQVVALTATATADVRSDILKHLDMREPFVTVSGFARPNLSFNILQTKSHDDKYRRLEEIVNLHRTGIVYCSTRKRVEEVCDQLAERDMSVIAYHGGMDEKERDRAQELFISRKKDIAVATNAFGMGIDRSDVRFVIHFDVPGSIEAYYQEAGRAGRDGEPGHCELFFNFADTRTQEFFIEGSNPSFEVIRDIYQTLLNLSDEKNEVEASIDDITNKTGLKNSMAVSSALSLLNREGYIERYDIPGKRIRGTRMLQPNVRARDLQLDKQALQEKYKRDLSKLKATIDFCYANECRQAQILRYFGEEHPETCGSCDICQKDSTAPPRPGTAEEILMLRQALSGIARMSWKRKDGNYGGRYGKGRIIAMLTGSRSKDVLDARLDQLSTYGCLKSLGAPALQMLFQELERHEFIETNPGEYPTLALTDKGVFAMKHGTQEKLRWPVVSSASLPFNPTTSPEIKTRELGWDDALFNKLKRLRTALAESNGKLSSRILSNAVLESLTRLQPTTVERALRIRGIGVRKAANYLPDFIRVIQQHKDGK